MSKQLTKNAINKIRTLEQEIKSLDHQIKDQLTIKKDSQSTDNNQNSILSSKEQNHEAIQNQVDAQKNLLQQTEALIQKLTQNHQQAMVNLEDSKQKVEKLKEQQGHLEEKVVNKNNFLAALIDFKAIFGAYKTVEEIDLSLNSGLIMSEIIAAKDLVKSEVLKDLMKKNLREEFDKVLAKVPDINAQDNEGKTLLMHSVLNGFYYGADRLIALGADIDILDNKGANALFYCANAPDIKYIKLIADKTHDINKKISKFDGNTVMHVLVAGTNNKVFSREMSDELKDADQNHFEGGTGIINEDCNFGSILGPREDGYTLQQEKTIRIVKYLVSKGADINAQNDQGVTPFFTGCNYRLKYLTKHLYAEYSIDQNIKDKDNNTTLHYAARVGDLELIQKLLKKNFDVNAKNMNSGTPISQAAARNDLITVKFLLSKSANPNILDNEGKHAIHYAAMYDALDVIKFFKAQNASLLNLIDNDGKSPLWLAVVENKAEMVKYLLVNGAKADSTNKEGANPLHVASSLGLKNIVEMLIPYCDVNKDTKDIDHGGKSPLWLAITKGNLETTEYLLANGARADIPNKQGIYPLHLASELGMTDIIETIASCCDVNQKTNDNNQVTAVWFAAQRGKTETIKKLIDLGAIPDIQRINDSVSPLHIAIYNKHIEAANELLDWGASTDIINSNQYNALHLAIKTGNNDFIKKVISNKNINSQNEEGNTALHIAISNGYTDTVHILLSNGSRTDISNKQGVYPLHMAAMNGSTYIIEILAPHYNVNQKTNDTNQVTSVWLAAHKGKTDAVKKLADLGADLNSQDADGNSTLLIATQNGHYNTVNMLLEEGVKADISNNKGVHPLHIAIATKNVEMVKCLIDNGTDVNKCDNNNASPLYYSLGYCGNYDIEIIKHLVLAGVDVNKPIYDGDTPMHMVGYKANIEAMVLLIKRGAKVDATNDQGKTPLHILIEKAEIDQTLKLEAIKMFLAYGADANIVNKEGKNAVTLAKKHLPEAVTWLEHPETLTTFQELEAHHNITSINSEVKNNSTVNQISSISYDNKLLNHLELVAQAAEKGDLSLSEAINLSFGLSKDLTEQVINNSNNELLLAGLISLE